MDKINSRRIEFIPTIARASPLLVNVFALLYCMISPSFESFYLLGLSVFTYFLNPFLKTVIAKPFYKLTGQECLPILGKGARPDGARSCHEILDGHIATTFGMPSGHSQIIWTIGTYIFLIIIARLINKIQNTNNKANSNSNKVNSNQTNSLEDILEYLWMIISSITILATMIYVSYSRVYIEGCHTLEQVIVGGLVGAALGSLAFYCKVLLETG